MKIKKIAIAVLAVALAFSVVGCKKDGDSGNKAKKSYVDGIKVGFVYIGSINDHGYTEAQDKSRLALEEMNIETLYKENVPENSDCEKAIRDLIDAGCNVIYTTSFGFMDSTINVAKEFPEIKFGHCSGFKTAENVSTYFGKMYEARYLAGIVAGLKTQTNKIGYVAAFPISECIRGINGFTQGVKSVNPAATVDVVWTNTWYDPTKEKQGALELLNRGCDVIEQHQDTTAPQVAAEEKGAFCIGYNVATPNAAPKAYLTAPVFNWAVFIKDDVSRIMDGSWESRKYWEGLSAGMVDLAPLSDLVAEGTAEKVAEARKAIEDGSLQIFAGPITDNEGKVRVPAGTVMTDDEVWNMEWFVEGVNGIIK
ncbi:MAG: BMP family ABC transporter substrate-binding protein [Treponemataceae bacterium]|nr:BMP family ABC transporter substrate-binding protein [Treponemataceae bacterium]